VERLAGFGLAGRSSFVCWTFRGRRPVGRGVTDDEYDISMSLDFRGVVRLFSRRRGAHAREILNDVFSFGIRHLTLRLEAQVGEVDGASPVRSSERGAAVFAASE